jgi:predicted DNA-binding transcriptional regulator AlpA
MQCNAAKVGTGKKVWRRAVVVALPPRSLTMSCSTANARMRGPAVGHRNYGCPMTLNEIPPVLSVREFCSTINKSRSWAYAEWKKADSDLPKPFKIGNATRILGEATVNYIRQKASV